MGYINRKYPIMEIGLSLEGKSPLASGSERKLVGDIISVHSPSLGLGLLEVREYLWLRVEDLEENEFAIIKQPMFQNENIFDKRRYCIPLERLQKVYPVLDVSRALDTNIIYQPFLPVDEDNFMFLEGQLEAPFSAHGLIFDKAIGDYI